MGQKEEIKYFHIPIRESSPLINQLRHAKITLQCLTYEELIQKLWNIVTKIEPALKSEEREMLK